MPGVKQALNAKNPPLPLPGGESGGFTAKNPDLSAQEGNVRAPRAKPLLLVVEDNPDNLTTIKAICQPAYQVLAAVNGAEGLQQAAAQRPDLILLDMSLPQMDGYAVVAQLKQQEATRAIPVIALTAHAMKGDREKILQAGCDDYLSKPVEPEELLARVKKWLSPS